MFFTTKTKKGQYLSFDVIVASVIFLITIVMLMSYWQSMKSTVMNENKYMLHDAMLISDNLMTDYSQIGIFEKSKQVANLGIFNEKDSAKIKDFQEKLKEFSGGNDVYIVLTNLNFGGKTYTFGTVRKDDGTYVPPNNNDNVNIAKITRILSIDVSKGGHTDIEPARLDVFVYKTKK